MELGFPIQACPRRTGQPCKTVATSRQRPATDPGHRMADHPGPGAVAPRMRGLQMGNDLPPRRTRYLRRATRATVK